MSNSRAELIAFQMIQNKGFSEAMKSIKTSIEFAKEDLSIYQDKIHSLNSFSNANKMKETVDFLELVKSEMNKLKHIL